MLRANIWAENSANSRHVDLFSVPILLIFHVKLPFKIQFATAKIYSLCKTSFHNVLDGANSFVWSIIITKVIGCCVKFAPKIDNQYRVAQWKRNGTGAAPGCLLIGRAKCLATAAAASLERRAICFHKLSYWGIVVLSSWTSSWSAELRAQLTNKKKCRPPPLGAAPGTA